MDYIKIKNYLEGKSGKSEEKEIKNWLQEPSNEFEIRQVLGNIWTNSEIELTGIEPDFEQMLNKVRYRLEAQAYERTPNSKIHQFYKSYSKVAAILLLPLLLVSIYMYINRVDLTFTNDHVAMHEVYTKPGTLRSLELADGTKVWLNDNTTLRYPEEFSGGKREVFVDGEAYFEVKSNSRRPFIVRNPMMNTVVTGTRFNLNAYSEDQYFEATLLEGKIQLESGEQKVDMLEGQQIQYDVAKTEMISREVNTANSSAWIDGKLVIHNEKLKIALKKISRWYNVEFVVEDKSLTDDELTCTMEDEKLIQALDFVATALSVQFEVKKENNKQMIYMSK